MAPVARRPSCARSSRPVKPVIAGSAERCSLFYDPRRVRPGWGCHPASDARCRDPHEEDRQARLSRRLVKGDRCTGPERLPSAAWPSVPLAVTNPLARILGLLARDLLQRGFRRAALRLLQSSAIHEHDLGPTKPRFELREEHRVERPALLKGEDDPAEVPRIKGCQELRSAAGFRQLRTGFRQFCAGLRRRPEVAFANLRRASLSNSNPDPGRPGHLLVADP
jgi:hypothetical protein